MEESGMQNAVPKERLIKCFGYLIVIRLAAAALSLLSMVPYVGAFADYISPVLTLATICILGTIGDRGSRYSKAAVMLLVSALLELVSGLLPLMGFPDAVEDICNAFAAALTLIASVCSFLAVYQEYNAHAELVGPVDQDLARRWHKLFNWQIVYLLVSYVMAFVLVAVFFEFPLAMQIYALCVRLVNLVIAWCYIQNLNAMCKRM